MAVGDVVNGIGLDGTIFIFQPAAGVEIMIGSTFSTSGNQLRITNGTDVPYTTATSPGQLNSKIFINNTIYLNLATAGAGYFNGYTGIQIK
jgi:hypothetical protein